MAKVSAVAKSEGLERRAQERQTMILRAGLLEQGGKPFFCLVRNVSATGIQVRVYGSAGRRGKVVVRVADDDPIHGWIVWMSAGNAGINFETAIDPATLLRLQQKLTSVRRRSMPRIKATSYAVLRIGGRVFQAVLKDISSLGAKVTTSRPLQIGERGSIRFPDLPELRAYVRWSDGPESGLVFETPIPMHDIAHWVEGRLRVTA